jgi:hypothetical protein
MKTKLASLLAITLLTVSCKTSNPKIIATEQTLILAAQKIAADLGQAALKTGFHQSSADFLRTLENTAVASATAQIGTTVKTGLSTWLPTDGTWQAFDSNISGLVSAYVVANPNNPMAVNTALESVAQGLQSVPAAPTGP